MLRAGVPKLRWNILHVAWQAYRLSLSKLQDFGSILGTKSSQHSEVTPMYP